MSGWEQQITELLQEMNSISVRFDVAQELTEEEKTQARENISIGATVASINGEDYDITIQ